MNLIGFIEEVTMKVDSRATNNVNMDKCKAFGKVQHGRLLWKVAWYPEIIICLVIELAS